MNEAGGQQQQQQNTNQVVVSCASSVAQVNTPSGPAAIYVHGGHSGTHTVVQPNNIPIMTSNSMPSLNGAQTITTSINSQFASPQTTPSSMVSQSPVNPQPTHMHQTMVHPNVTPSPIPQQVQVIQQPLHSPTAYLNHMYGGQQQLLMPGNITMSPSIQVIAAGKTCVGNQGGMMLAGKQMIQGQSNYIPQAGNQTLVIGQLLPQQSSLVSTHTKQVADPHKVRPFVMSPAGSLQSKSPILPQQNHPGAGQPQMLNNAQFKQLTSQATIVSTPQLITSQAPAGAMIASQSQIINGLQAISTSLPPHLTWTTHGGLQSHVLTAQNPIFFRSSQQENMYIQSQPTAPTPIQPQPQTNMVHQQTTSHLLKANKVTNVIGGKSFATILPSMSAPIRPASSVATQTNAMANLRPQLKQRTKGHMNRVAPGFNAPMQYQKADAANQTKIFLTPHQAPIPIQMGVFPEGINVMRMTTANMMPMPISSSNTNGMIEAMDTSDVIQTDVNSHMISNVSVSAGLNIISPAMNTTSASAMQSRVENGVKEMGLQTPNPAIPVSAANTTVVMQDNGQMLQQLLQPAPEVHEVAVGTENAAKDKQPQKAIVKPNVLTHIIEGYIIQESGDPFPVSRSTLSNELSSPKQMITSHHSNETTLNINPEITTPSESPDDQVPKSQPSPQQQTEQHSEPTESWPAERVSPLELAMAKCEYCGKLDYVARFKRSKRFCSSSCAKRYAHHMGSSSSSYALTGADVLEYSNTSSSLKHSFSSHHKMRKYKSHSDGNKYGKKRKHGPKMKKSARKLERSRMVYNAEEWVRAQNPIESPGKEEETNSSNSGAESSMSPVTPTNSKDILELDSGPRKPPKKWSVQEVFEFIKALPGCADYAEDFRLQEIDGHALLLLKEDHLMTAMNMKLGPALKICAKITTLKEEMQRQ